MNKQHNRLSAKRVAQLTQRGLHHDGGGLYLQVAKGGARSWVLRFERCGVKRLMGLGPLHTIGLAEARMRARKARQQLFDGIDPITARQEQRARAALQVAQGATFRDCAERYIASHEASWGSVHRGQWRKTLALYAYPVLGDIPIAMVDTALVLKVLEPIWGGDPKTARPVTAQRLRGRIERVLNWAKAHGMRAGENPALWRGHLDQLLAKPTNIKQHLAALPFIAVPALMTDLRACDDMQARALEFVVLTAVRAGEMLGARWSEIDLQGKVWTIPGERMKAGREHRVPLSDRAIAILNAMPRDLDQVFPRMASPAILKRLHELRPACTVHGFRSSFRDWCADQTSFPREVAEAALAHAVGDATERAYRRGDALEKRRELMDAWASFCAEEPRTGAVIAFARQ